MTELVFVNNISSRGIPAALCRTQIAEMEHFYGRLLGILAQNRQAPPSVEAHPVADQVAKLWELKQSGALTEEEFAGEKARVLGLGKI